jgi:hypothetical protein
VSITFAQSRLTAAVNEAVFGGWLKCCEFRSQIQINEINYTLSKSVSVALIFIPSNLSPPLQCLLDGTL